jgi:O-antigen/teichoic acid export membrane protein
VSFECGILFGGLSAWFSRGLNILLSLALIPILFRHLAKEELGVWLLLTQSWAALGLFDLGFGIVLTRRIAFTIGKARGLANPDLAGESLAEISELIAIGRRVYSWLAILTFSVSFVSGFIYLGNLELCALSRGTVWSAWAILCLSQSIGISVSVWTSVLQGAGFVGWDGILGSLSNTMALLLQILVVLMGGGLVVLALVAAGGAVTQRWLIVGFIRWRRPQFFNRGQWNPAVLRGMLSPAIRAWLTSLGYLLVANTDQLFIAAQRGPAVIPAYRAAFLLVVNLYILSGVFSGAAPVFVSQLWQAGEVAAIRSILQRNARTGLLAMGCGGAVILVLGPTLFELWLGAGNFVGYAVLGTFLASFILEHHANVFSTCARATNDEAYAVSSLAGGVLKLVLAWGLTARLGLAGLALSTLLAQGVTNDWYMVYRSASRLGVNFGEHVRQVLVPVAVVSGTAFGLGFLVNRLFKAHPPELRVALVTLAGGLVLAISTWRLVLDRTQRNWVLGKVGIST